MTSSSIYCKMRCPRTFQWRVEKKRNIFFKKCNKTSSGGIFSSFNSLWSSNKLISVQAYLTHALVIDDLIFRLGGTYTFFARAFSEEYYELLWLFAISKWKLVLSISSCVNVGEYFKVVLVWELCVRIFKNCGIEWK